MTNASFGAIVGNTADQRETFFKLIFGRNEGYICIAYKEQNRHEMIQEFYQYPNELPRMLSSINRHSGTGGRHTYFCTQLLNDAIRKKENVIRCPMAWADLDSCDPSLLLVRPTVTIQTSPGRWQAVWLFDEEVKPYDAEAISRKIAYYHRSSGADISGWILTKLLRVPYTVNLKYGDLDSAPIITVVEASRRLYRASDFKVYPEIKALEFVNEATPLMSKEDPLDILQKFRATINPKAFELFSEEPKEDWSKHLWKLLKFCAEAGLPRQDTFTIASSAACNKYERDGRPKEDLWREVGRAYVKRLETTLSIPTPETVIYELLTNDEIREVTKQETFLERYIKWGNELTDASPQYHQAGALILLSALISGSTRLETSFGPIIPNLWFIIAGDTTLTRKAQPLDAKILTPTGWQLMGDIEVGDEVIGSDGMATKVVGTYPQGMLKTYRVTFNDGASTECSNNHLWTHKRPGKRSEYSTWCLSEIMRKGWQDAHGTWVRQIPMVEPIQFTHKELPLDPYLLGLLLGNGSFENNGSVRFTGIDKEVLQYIEKEISQYGLWFDLDTGENNCTYRITKRARRSKNYISNVIKNLGLRGLRSWEKSIPPMYLMGSAEQRLDLLQGLMDTDGWVDVNRSASFQSSSKQLALDVQYLVRSLGGWSHYDNGHSAGYRNNDGEYINCKDGHLISVSTPMHINPFRLTRKFERLNGKRTWARPRAIKNIEYIGEKPMKCIRVENSNGLYITDDFVVTHNSTTLRMAISLINEIDPSIMFATDGTMEGILSGLKGRDGKASLFYRDEFTGLIQAMLGKEYMSDMPEHLTKLYDGDTMKRLLRREEITVTNPVFLLYAAGIKSKIQTLLTEEHIASGFIPRFIFITAEADVSRLRPLGPPVINDNDWREQIKNELIDIKNHYSTPTRINKNGKILGTTPPDFPVTLTRDAWQRYNDFETTMTKSAMDTGLEYLTPVYDRLAKSTLKVAILLAASQQREDKVIVDRTHIIHAIYYCRLWQAYANEMVNGVGKSRDERIIDQMHVMLKNTPGGIPRSRLMSLFRLNAKQAGGIFDTMLQRQMIYAVDFSGQPKYHPCVERNDD